MRRTLIYAGGAALAVLGALLVEDAARAQTNIIQSQQLTLALPQSLPSYGPQSKEYAPYFVPFAAVTVTTIEGSTSATPATDTTALAADSFRRLLTIRNTDPTNALRYVVGGSTTANSSKLNPGDRVVYDAAVPSGAVHVQSSSASVHYTIEEGN